MTRMNAKELMIYRKELKFFLLSLLEAIAGYGFFSFFTSLIETNLTFTEALCQPAAPVFAYLVFVYYYFVRRRKWSAA